MHHRAVPAPVSVRCRHAGRCSVAVAGVAWLLPSVWRLARWGVVRGVACLENPLWDAPTQPCAAAACAQGASPLDTKYLRNELAVLTSMAHENLIRFHGACVHEGNLYIGAWHSSRPRAGALCKCTPPPPHASTVLVSSCVWASVACTSVAWSAAVGLKQLSAARTPSACE
jgi:hypothetical protein